jgi:hypothetical protein
VIYQFKTMDDELFAINTVDLKWGRASSIVAAPTLATAEKAIASFVFVEEGELVPMGAGRYSLNGRTPETTGPGAGLSTIQLMSVPFDTYIVLYLLPNVECKEDSFVMNFMTEELRAKYLKMEVRNPEKPKQQITAVPEKSPEAIVSGE